MKNSILQELNLRLIPDDALEAMYQAIKDERIRRNRADGFQKVTKLALSAKEYGKFNQDHHKYNHHLLKHLDAILMADWSSLFQSGDESRKFYVYIHAHPSGAMVDYSHAESGVLIKTKGLPFYVGKGTGGRAYDLKRNQGHGKTLEEMKHANPGDIVCIVKDGMTEKEAYELESKLIYFFGTVYEKGRKGILVNLDLPARPF